MSGQIRRSSKGILSIVISGFATVALAAPATAPAYPADAHGVVTPGQSVNARGTDVAAADQQSTGPVFRRRSAGADAGPSVNARGTDVAAADQQSPRSTAEAGETGVPASGDSPALFPIIGLVVLGGLALASGLAVGRRRGRVTA
jgi:hypothetical protein